ncbi:hypothetical protein [Aeromonas veronii]|uniref:hypothetical protein n=1 Tax=Aeromonas veronii TaxID=654 RepID=UPI0031FCD4A8
MRVEDVKRFFGSAAKASKAIDIDRCNLSKWKKANNGIVPANHAVSFVIASGHQLEMGWEDYSLGHSLSQKAA